MFEIFQLWERLFEDVTIEEDESLQRAILRGSRYLSLHGEMVRKVRISGAPMSAGWRL